MRNDYKVGIGYISTPTLFFGVIAMKIYDCFTFFNEFELLELRLETLYDAVDYFVIVEANKTHNNEPKPFNFLERRNDYRKYFPKIMYVPMEVDMEFKGDGDWAIENAQRNEIMRGLTDAEPDDLIFISDLDEIPSPYVVERIMQNRQPIEALYMFPFQQRGGKRIAVPCRLMVPAAQLLEYIPIAMQQTLHYYYLNLLSTNPWFGSVLVKRKNLSVPQSIRNIREHIPRALDGGWHFTYMGGFERLMTKIDSIVEGRPLMSRLSPEQKERKYLEQLIAEGKDIYGRTNHGKIDCRPCKLEDINLPTLDWFAKKYPHFVQHRS